MMNALRDIVTQTVRILSSRIALSMFFVAMGMAAGRLITTTKEIVVASRFGTTAAMDAFLLALSLVLFPIAVFGSGIWGALIPLLNKSGDDPKRLSYIIWPSFGALLGIGILSAIVITLAAPLLENAFLAGNHEGGRAPFLAIMPVLAWFVPLGLVSVWGGAILAWHKDFFLASFTDSFPAAGVLVFALLGMLSSQLEMAWGVVCGGGVAVLILLFAVIRKVQIGGLLYTEIHQEVRSAGNRYMLTILASMLFACLPLAEQYAAAHLGEGGISRLGYTQRLFSVVLALVSAPLSRTSLSFMSEPSENENLSIFKRRVRHYIILCIGGGTMLTLAGWIMAEPIIRILYERGAFTREDTLIVAEVVRYYALQIPFYLLAIFMTSLAYAAGRQKIILGVAAVNLMVCIAGNLTLTTIFGLSGIALTSLITQGSSCAMFLFSGVLDVRWVQSSETPKDVVPIRENP